MASETDIANNALIKLGAGRITSLTQEHKNARVINEVYTHIRDSELRKHVWNFAKKKQKLAQSGTAPVSGFDYSYPLPSDCLRVVNVSSNDAETGVLQYEIVGRAIETDSVDVWLTFIKRETDPNVMDVAFREMLAASIAMKIANAIEGVSTSKAALLKEYRAELRQAKSADAIEDFPEQFPEPTWTSVRH